MLNREKRTPAPKTGSFPVPDGSGAKDTDTFDGWSAEGPSKEGCVAGPDSSASAM